MVGRERAGGRDFVYADSSKSKERESKVKPTIEAFKMRPKQLEPFRRLPKKGRLENPRLVLNHAILNKKHARKKGNGGLTR